MNGPRIRLAAAIVLVVPLLAYPLAVLASGRPTFPGDRGECAVAAHDGDEGRFEVVVAHLALIPDAEALRRRVLAAGVGDMKVEPDGCGWWKVTAYGIETYAAAQSLADAVHRAGFPARVERDTSVP